MFQDSAKFAIYNSRNYWSLLAKKVKEYPKFLSTIVEIIEAY